MTALLTKGKTAVMWVAVSLFPALFLLTCAAANTAAGASIYDFVTITSTVPQPGCLVPLFLCLAAMGLSASGRKQGESNCALGAK